MGIAGILPISRMCKTFWHFNEKILKKNQTITQLNILWNSITQNNIKLDTYIFIMLLYVLQEKHIMKFLL